MSAPTSQHDMRPGILGAYYPLTALALMMIITRSWIRTTITKYWGWDDHFIIIAWAFSFAGLILIQLGANLGSSPISTTHPGDTDLKKLRFNTFFEMSNVCCTLTTKYSICLYILRIRNSSRLRWILGILMTPMTLITVAVVIVLSASCTPLWSNEIPSKCVSVKGMYNVAYVQSSLTIVTDICLTSAPVIILRNVRIKRGKKVFICSLMSLGLLATISNVLRTYFQVYQTSRSISFNMTWLTVVCIMEQSSGIIAACIPACVPIFRKKTHAKKLQPANTQYYELSNSYSSDGKKPGDMHSGVSSDTPDTT
ncbi:hypothetical protein BO79DRAFT_254357 [Aspergillus costaricaensis CBS 115574]|uniref:Uncharacterized protein n=1 Tax=Aspergillus costaricaensis CBS 115574 TaxID=1448317 RepID=A0ACD1IGU8_9EURO|nr:hypothetical protein BO79DRAFT_254357 [Aspergillus costaricaensis CBS 115574]RAK89608.1 hypothetical protein BO79DRAFT_254357 [Aspergillus costaricaensis CBS 115574]